MSFKCPKCGAELADNTTVCLICGEHFNEKEHCANCGAALDKDAAICPACGVSVDDTENTKEKQISDIPVSSAPKKDKGNTIYIIIGFILIILFFMWAGGVFEPASSSDPLSGEVRC